MDLVEYTPDMGWTGESWLFSSFMNDSLTSLIATGMYLISTIIIVIGGITYFTDSSWMKTSLIVGSVLSSITIVIFWDGVFDKLVEKGLLGLILNLIILAVLFFQE